MELEAILSRYPKKQDYVIEILLDLQKKKDTHFVAQHEINQIAEYLEIPESHVCSVMSFYTLLSTKPRGKYIVQVCKDVPCFVNDDFNVLETVKRFLGISLGETTKDQIFTLEQTACIGCCDEAPAMRINENIYTNLTKQKVCNILKEYRGRVL